MVIGGIHKPFLTPSGYQKRVRSFKRSAGLPKRGSQTTDVRRLLSSAGYTLERTLLTEINGAEAVRTEFHGFSDGRRVQLYEVVGAGIHHVQSHVGTCPGDWRIGHSPFIGLGRPEPVRRTDVGLVSGRREAVIGKEPLVASCY